ncbi:hypothetical protein [Streptomyces sp. NPDC005148]
MEAPLRDPGRCRRHDLQAIRVTALRRTRYRNLPTTRLGHVFAATALNLTRIDRWLTGTPLRGTRTSHLESLMLAA